EIRTSKSSPGPNEGWLEIAKTNSAKSHIRKALLRRDAEIMREEYARKGKESCLDSFRMQGIEEEEMEKYLDTPNVLNEYHCQNLTDLYVMMNGKNPTPMTVINFLGLKKKRTEVDLSKVLTHKGVNKKAPSDDKSPIEVAGGVTNLAISFAQCCRPIPGDPLVGYITKGKGITIHRRNCPNIQPSDPRLIDVHWKKDLGITQTYPVEIEIFANDRPNLLGDIVSTFGSKGISMSDLKAHVIQQTMNSVFTITAFVSDAKVLEDLFALLLGVKGVYSVSRLTH
ncbi:MAG: bifunctional (p)ppGpp synthetase/guanosine-3',5'-bis(diphosphate) 3'-pyrophosphohydrolase, partial [Bacilli bacterium]|nr:bifunctional (p)ppGpp synthetase/guanosine-3',5'-bis(diphosphate) 3'-pyrophosphohydrolase [Bacilli bacterium]